MSVSIEIEDRRGRRKRTFSWIIRSDENVPTPASVRYLFDLGRPSLSGMEELFENDCWLVLNESFRYPRWEAELFYVNGGDLYVVRTDKRSKALVKSLGMSPDLLAGAGDAAACLRTLHGLRMHGMTVFAEAGLIQLVKEGD